MFSSEIVIPGAAFCILSLLVTMKERISCSVNFSNTNTLHLLSSALLIVKLGFSVVAHIKIIVHFSTKGSKTSCWALFRRWISSRKIMVCLPYWWFSFACSISLVTSSFLLVTPDKGKKSAWRDCEIICAIVVLPHPGGPQKIIEGILLFCKKTRIGLFSPTRCTCQTNSSKLLGLRSEAIGSNIIVLSIKYWV